jgi:GTP-binding protein EngB required for normal cell division
MLERQNSFVSYLQQLAALLESSDIKCDPQLLARVSNTEMLVPVIGAFSAGKSSLLNALLDCEVLPVGIAPETELATEIRFSSEPYLLAIHTNGQEERLPVEALADINQRAQQLSHLQLYINSPVLKDIAPLVLVDMPGYGSSLESHNKAIAFYLPRGVHFVVVTSVEDGNLTQSMIRRLDEVKTYGGDFTFVLSKCNLRPAAQVEQVRTYIDEQLQVYFEGDHKTLVVGKDGITGFSRALEQIDANELFGKLFLDALKSQSHDLIRQFNLAISAVKKDDGQSEQQLRSLEQALANLRNQQEDMQEQIRERYSSRLLNRCLRGVEDDLNQAVDELLSLASTPGGNRLNSAISEIIRSSLTRNIQKEIDDISDAMIDDLATGLSTASANFSDLEQGEGWVGDLSARVKESLEKTNQMLDSWSNRLEARKAEGEQLGRLYKGVSVVLAVTTSVVAPLLELAIIFLPEILRMFNAGKEQQALRNKLQNEVFPGIKAELRSRLPEILDEQLTLMLGNINQSFEAQINQQQTIINTYRQRSDASKADTTARVAELEEQANAVKALATQHLYV